MFILTRNYIITGLGQVKTVSGPSAAARTGQGAEHCGHGLGLVMTLSGPSAAASTQQESHSASHISIVHGFPQRMRLPRRLYEIYSFCYLTFMIHYHSFFGSSLNKTFKYCVQGRIWNLTWRSSYLKSCRSSLQSHPLWVTLYMK